MQFRIADTFTESLSRLANDEQKAVKMTAFDLQVNPANPGMQFHKIDRARDKHFWSVRVSRDIRLIVHKTKDSLLLCYVDHHDDAYAWAERRRMDRHPKTGAIQLVEVQERTEEITVRQYAEPEERSDDPAVFAGVADDTLLGYGVPTEWLDTVRQATETRLLEIAEHLPAEAAEALLDLATGAEPRVAEISLEADADPFEHPDSQRRFRLMHNQEELARALDYPWERWSVFLHPEQRRLVERDYSGPARVAGTAGTGKTVVALHRAVHLARRNPSDRVLLTTFSDALANALRGKLRQLIDHEPWLAESIEVTALDTLGERLHTRRIGRTTIASQEELAALLVETAGDDCPQPFTRHFLVAEWRDVVDAWQLKSWEEYRDVARLGRKTRLPERQRVRLWKIFSTVLDRLHERGLTTRATVFTALAADIGEKGRAPFDHVVVDEAQDLRVGQLRFLAALAGDRPQGLFVAGDLGQRIFQTPFSWKSLGVDVRGRSHTLRINYRTSHQIRRQADRLLDPEVSDVDGNVEDRRGTLSVFNGPTPVISAHETAEAEATAVAQWLRRCTEEGLEPQEIAVFVRSSDELERAKHAVIEAGLAARVLDERMESVADLVPVSTMHLAKGLEFRAVAVMACDDEIIPSQTRIEAVGDSADLEEVYETERHLLYVACTRARDFLLVSGVSPVSEFVDDFTG